MTPEERFERIEAALDRFAQDREYLAHFIRSHDDQISRLVVAQQTNDRQIAQLVNGMAELRSHMFVLSEIVRSHKARLDQIDGKAGEP